WCAILPRRTRRTRRSWGRLRRWRRRSRRWLRRRLRGTAPERAPARRTLPRPVVRSAGWAARGWDDVSMIQKTIQVGDATHAVSLEPDPTSPGHYFAKLGERTVRLEV